MRLKSMLLHGFKSFAKPTRLSFAEGVTAIVGPNGGGKSNIVDAIRWVFGEQSMRQLRAEEKFDVIFAGSSMAPAGSFAYVELTFEHDGDTFTVARMLSNDGKNIYMLNGESVRLKDIHERFAGTGAGKELYSIVGQGQIERITNATPEEIRVLFEEAAGTSFYKEKKREALMKLENVSNNLVRIQDLLVELDRQKKSLYLKAKRAERYKEYVERLDQVKKFFFGNVLKRDLKRLENLQAEFANNQEKINQVQKKLIELESQWSTLKQEFANVDKEIEAFTTFLEDYKKRQIALSEMREIYNRKLSELESHYVELNTKIYLIDEQNSQLLKRKDELSLIFKALLEEVNQKEQQLRQAEQAREEILSRYSEKEKNALLLREKLSSLEKKRVSLENELTKLDETLEDLRRRISMLQTQLSAKIERLNALQYELSTLFEKSSKTSHRKSKLSEELKAIESQIGHLKGEREQLLEKLDEIRRNLRYLDDEEKRLRQLIASYEGYSRAVRTIFAKKAEGEFTNVHDVVGNLLNFQPEHAKAIEALLGGAVQHVVVDSAEDARNIIEWLKKEKIGRVTFLPLDLIEPQFVRLREIENHPGFVGYAAQLVTVSQQFSNLPAYLFGSDVIVRNLEDAIDMKRKYRLRCRIATLDGEIIGPHGSITGGETTPDRGDSLIIRKTKLNEISLQRMQYTSLEKKLDSNLKQIEEELDGLKRQRELVEKELLEIATQDGITKRMIEELGKTFEDVKKEVDSLQQLEREYKSRSEGLKLRKQEILNQLDAVRVEVEEFQKNIEIFDKELVSEKRLLEEVSTRYLELKADLTSAVEKKIHYESELERIKSQMEKSSEEKIYLQRQAVELETQIERTKLELLENARELESIRKETEELFESMRMQRMDKDQKLNQLNELETRMNQLKEEREKLRENSHHLELLIQEVKSRIEQHLKEIDIDSAQQVEELSEEVLEALKNEMEDLQNKIKYLGPVDLTAIEEYNEVEKRYEELAMEKKDLEESKKKIEELIEKTDEEARKRFLDVYEQVNAAFSRYVSQLFPGAEGEIRLEAGKDLLESGLEISLKKPGKRMQKLQLLSGGEKSLVGIALLFSLMEVNPSPFYVLDEIDAALDEFNAERFKRLLIANKDRTQFIVITHNKAVMEAASVLHGIAMVDGISNVVPVELENLAIEG
ncbi:chromosome segregation protein SMC [Pseudothermotoga sp.]|nr:chromosome segregation protein SMC [Pseudothermotoga sp.]MDW8138936.1 chromosome segregation protein SMC [Pseudothermotoga sp.]